MKRRTPHSSSRRLSDRHAGASLLEAIAFLGVAATIIVGAVALLSTAFSGARSNRSQEEVVAISTGVKRLFMSQAGSYGTADLTEALVNAKVFPSTLAVSGTTVSNAWNGAVAVTGATSTFTISYAAVPQDVCVELVADSGQWIGVTVNGGASMAPPIAVATASGACNSATNTIVWTGR